MFTLLCRVGMTNIWEAGAGQRHLGLDLEHRSSSKSAAAAGCTVEIAGGIEDQTRVGLFAVGAGAGEDAWQALGPSAGGGRQFEDCADAVCAAVSGRAVEIASVEYQASVGSPSVGAVVGEVVQQGLGPDAARAGRQLECRTVVIRAAKKRGAVEIAGGVEDDSAVDVVAVDAVYEKAMQHLLGPGAARAVFQLEDGADGRIAALGSTALQRGAIEIAGIVEDEAGIGNKAVGAILVEVMQNLLRPAPARVLRFNSNTVP